MILSIAFLIGFGIRDSIARRTPRMESMNAESRIPDPGSRIEGDTIFALLMSSYHAAHLTEDAARTGVWQVIADHLSPWIPPQGHVLEIGAGYCDWINHVRAARRVAVDVWEDLPAHAAPGVEARVLDAATDLQSLGRSAFDAVLASNVLEHFTPDVAGSVVGDVVEALKPGGRFI